MDLDESDLRDYFDYRPGIFSTFTEMAHMAGELDFEQWVSHGELQKRPLIYVLYADYRDTHPDVIDGFLAWKRHTHECGIEGYRENVALMPYRQYALNPDAFIDRALAWDQTLCFFGADMKSLQTFKQKNLFHETPLRHGIAIPLQYPRETLPTPSQIQGMIRHPPMRPVYC